MKATQIIYRLNNLDTESSTLVLSNALDNILG